MAIIDEWNPPAFLPDGTLTAQGSMQVVPAKLNDGPLTTSLTTGHHRGKPNSYTEDRIGAHDEPTGLAAAYRQDTGVPRCAIIFGGLNTMYVSPDVWILPLQWREKTVQFFPTQPSVAGVRPYEDDARNREPSVHISLETPPLRYASSSRAAQSRRAEAYDVGDGSRLLENPIATVRRASAPSGREMLKVNTSFPSSTKPGRVVGIGSHRAGHDDREETSRIRREEEAEEQGRIGEGQLAEDSQMATDIEVSKLSFAAIHAASYHYA